MLPPLSLVVVLTVRDVTQDTLLFGGGSSYFVRKGMPYTNYDGFLKFSAE